MTSITKIAGAGSYTGTPVWYNSRYITADDDQYALCTVPANSDSSTLRAKSFGFGIPTDATLNGIVVEIKRRNNTSLANRDVTIQLVGSNGSAIGSNYADTQTLWPITAAIATYGGNTDLWDTTLTIADINDDDFGLIIQCHNNSESSARNASIDAVWITVYYEGGVPLVSDVPLYWMIAGALDGFQPGNNDTVYNTLKTTVQDNIANNPYVNGVLLGAYWKNIEQIEGEFSWTRLDGIIDIIIAANLPFKFMFMPGIQCPDWLLALPTVDLFHTTVSNPYRTDYGQQVSIPIPWNSVYQTKWFAAISAMATHLDTKNYLAHCVGVVVSPWAFTSVELHLPKSSDDLAQWSALGAVDHLPDVMEDTLNHYATCFPTQRLALHTPFGILNNDDLSNELVEIALQNYASRLSIQSNTLHGKRDISQEGRFVSMRAWKSAYPAIELGSQSLASMMLPVDTATERQGTMRGTVQNVRDCGCDDYFEVWHGNGKNVAIMLSLTQLFNDIDATGSNEDDNDEGFEDGATVETIRRRHIRGTILKPGSRILHPYIRYQRKPEQ